MLKAIFYKEWIKSRNMVLLLLTIAVLLVIYTFINTAHMFRSQEAIALWLAVVDKDMPIVSQFVEWFLVIVAMLISAVQYTSEMVNKRFKLTLHLPMSESRIVGSLLIYGIVTTLAIQLFTTISLVAVLSFYYPLEFICAMLMQILPYALAGLATYLFVAWVVLEPIWKRRIINFIYATIAISSFILGSKGGDYIYCLPYLVAIVGVALACSFFSTIRFKDGAQN